VIIEGWDVARASAADLEAVCKLAAEIPAEIWISASARRSASRACRESSRPRAIRSP